MRKFKILTIAFILLFLESCINNSPEFELENHSSKVYDSVHLFTSTTKITAIKSLEPNEIRKGNIYFDETIKNDGCYKLVLFQKGNSVKDFCFGYYTNGASLDDKFIISIIENDSIIVE